jgi:hypothetical protein
MKQSSFLRLYGGLYRAFAMVVVVLFGTSVRKAKIPMSMSSSSIFDTASFF